MDTNDIAKLRLKAQHLATNHLGTVSELMEWMGAMQAQDYAMAKWGIGIRMPNLTDKDVTDAIDSGEVIRTHVMRPTWHFVSANDIYWMLELTAPRILASMKGRHQQLEMTEAVIRKSNKTIVDALSYGEHLTRNKLVSELSEAGFQLKDNRAAHLLMQAELEGLICSGKTKGKKQTYALLAERVPVKNVLSKEEALARLALNYFTSHGPATIQDFIWWSGLRVKDAKAALEMIGPYVASEQIQDQTYWFAAENNTVEKFEESVYLLPAFDEFIISYKDRSASVLAKHQKKAFSSYGVFWPVVVVNGKVIGLWKRTIKKETVLVEISLFQSIPNKLKASIEQKAYAFGEFLGLKADVRFQKDY